MGHPRDLRHDRRKATVRELRDPLFFLMVHPGSDRALKQ